MNLQAYQINRDQKLHLSALTSQNSFSDRQANKMCFRNSKHRPQQQEHTRPRQRFRLHHQMSSTIPNPVREHQTSQIFLKIRHKMRADINDCIVATRLHLKGRDGDKSSEISNLIDALELDLEFLTTLGGVTRTFVLALYALAAEVDASNF